MLSATIAEEPVTLASIITPQNRRRPVADGRARTRTDPCSPAERRVDAQHVVVRLADAPLDPRARVDRIALT